MRVFTTAFFRVLGPRSGPTPGSIWDTPSPPLPSPLPSSPCVALNPSLPTPPLSGGTARRATKCLWYSASPGAPRSVRGAERACVGLSELAQLPWPASIEYFGKKS